MLSCSGHLSQHHGCISVSRSHASVIFLAIASSVVVSVATCMEERCMSHVVLGLLGDLWDDLINKYVFQQQNPEMMEVFSFAWQNKYF